MDLSEQAIYDVIHPTAIFSIPSAPTESDDRHKISNGITDPSWADSYLNPKNRFDSLDPPKIPLWKIDGCAGFGTHFYAVPLCFRDLPPVRFDVFISEQAVESPQRREALDMDKAFHARDHDRLQRLGICSYLLRALHAWTERVGLAEVEQLYYRLPFGSRIVFLDLPCKAEDVAIQIAHNSDLEDRQNTAAELTKMWPEVESIPQATDIYDLVFVKQLHDSVCVVRYRNECAEPDKGGVFAFKALTYSVKFMYHELRVLLNMPSHPNVISRPTKLVTKRSCLTPKREHVVGFLTRYYSGGGLRDELPLLRQSNSLELKLQVRLGMELCAALLHIHYQAGTFYPDLRLDQIVFSTDREHPIIVDFEQRGVWCEFAAPEINATEHVMAVADHDEPDQEDEYETAIGCGLGLNGSWLSPRRFQDIVNRLHPSYKKFRNAGDKYDNPLSGYNIPWICLTRKEQEYAEVYMLGRLLWCVFEGMSAPQRGAVWQSYQNEPEFDFPQYQNTPDTLRNLIDWCTKGRRKQLSDRIVRKGTRIVLREDPRGDGNPEEIKAVAKEFWLSEVRWAEEFVLARERSKAEGTWDENHFGRPTLSEVYRHLRVFFEALEMQNGI